jgi:hypothetical protein
VVDGELGARQGCQQWNVHWSVPEMIAEYDHKQRDPRKDQTLGL